MSPPYDRIPSSQFLEFPHNETDADSLGAASSAPLWIEMEQEDLKGGCTEPTLDDHHNTLQNPGKLQALARKYWITVITVTVLTLAFALVPPIIAGLMTTLTIWEYDWTCLPNGIVTTPYSTVDHFNQWDISALLNISVAWGHMEFKIAKLIDILWDTVVGRGGQILLTVLLHRVLSQALLYSMEKQPASFRMFATTAFEIGTFTAMRVYVQGLYQERKARGIRLTLLSLAFILGTAYVIAFPTILSGISGYRATSFAMFETNAGNLVIASRLQRVLFIIGDGTRVNLTSNYLVTVEDDYEAPTNQSLSVQTVYRTVEYYDKYYIDYTGPHNISTDFTFNDIGVHNLEPPILNITRVNMYSFEGNSYGRDWLQDQDHWYCQPTSHYQWGFSFLGLFILLVLTSTFATTLYAVWLRTYLFSRVDRSGRRLGLYRAVLDIASNLRQVFTSNCDSISNKSIKEELKWRSTGMRITVEDLPEPRISVMKQLKLGVLEAFFWGLSISIIVGVVVLAPILGPYYGRRAKPQAGGEWWYYA